MEYVVVVVSASFVGQGETHPYAFACSPKPRGGAYSVGGVVLYQWGGITLLVAVHSVGYGGGGERGSWYKL